MCRVPAEKPSTITSSVSLDADYVKVTSSQDGVDAGAILMSDKRQEFLQGRCNVTPPTDDNCVPRSSTISKGRDEGQGQGKGQRLSTLRSSSVDVISDSKKTASCQKPQKPVKPKNLPSLMSSRPATGNGVTAQQSGSSLGTFGSPGVNMSPADQSLSSSPASSSSSQPSDVHVASQQSQDDVETTPGQTASTEPAPECSNIGRPSEHFDDSNDTTCGQTSLCSNDKRPQNGTIMSQSFSLSSSINVSCTNTEVTDETISRQGSARSEDDRQSEATTVFTEPSPDINRLSQYSSSGVESTCGQISLYSEDNRPRDWTTPSTGLTPQSCHDSLLSEPAYDGVEVTRRQNSPRCEDERPKRWTQTSRQVPVGADADLSVSDLRLLGPDECIEPPVIYDLMPANVHIRQGETLRLVTQFTAFPPPGISWFRANDLLTPGQSILIKK